MAADDPSHDRVEAEPVGIVHVVVPAKAPENGLAELRDKTVATVLPTTGVGEYVPGNLAQSDRIIQFPVRQQPGVGSDLGTVELKLEPAVKVQPQNPLFRSTHRGSHINTHKYAYNVMILIPESGRSVAKSQGHLGNAGVNMDKCLLGSVISARTCCYAETQGAVHGRPDRAYRPRIPALNGCGYDHRFPNLVPRTS